MSSLFEVVVLDDHVAYSGHDEQEARRAFREEMEYTMKNGGHSVFLMKDKSPIDECQGAADDEDEG